MGQPQVAFVLGGGGLLGAGEVGMLQALLEAGVVPDVVVGTSVGALNGAAVAADPSPGAVDRLRGVWLGLADTGLYSGGALRRVGHFARTRTSVHPNEPLRALLTEHLGDGLIEDLAVPFQCVAASIERAAEHWFTTGSVVDAVLASSAVPGVLPPVRIGDETYLDGGLVNSIPVERAVDPRGTHAVRAAGRPDRPAAAGTDQAVGGRVGGVRDRPPAPVRPRHGDPARRRRRCTCCPPAPTSRRATATCPPCATATSAPSSSASPPPTARPRSTWSALPSGARECCLPCSCAGSCWPLR